MHPTSDTSQPTPAELLRRSATLNKMKQQIQVVEDRLEVGGMDPETAHFKASLIVNGKNGNGVAGSAGSSSIVQNLRKQIKKQKQLEHSLVKKGMNPMSAHYKAAMLVKKQAGAGLFFMQDAPG